MKASKDWVAIFLVGLFPLIISCQLNRAEREFTQARTALLEMSMKADSAGVVSARQRFVWLLQDDGVAQNDSLAAWSHYFIAFANWQLAFVTFGNQEGAKQIITGALAHLDSAVAKKENLIDAYAVSRRCLYWLFVLDPVTGRSVWPKGQKALEKARTLAPEHPLVRLEEAIDLFYRPAQAGGDRQQGLARFQAAVKCFEQLPPEDVAYQKWWQATALMMLGQAYLGAENPEEAQKTFTAALTIQPQFEYVKSAMLPMTQLFTPPPMRNLNGITWKPLAVDAENDGVNPNWAEVKALSYCYDALTDMLWLKLDLNRLPNPNAFGINLVVDTDQNQQTGANWWGRNRAFKYDKLATVWVVKTGENAYRGTVGIADARGVQLGRFTNLFQNNLVFSAEAEKKTMILGLKSADLDADGNLNLIAAVGSNAGWNDDIPDSHSVEIRLRNY